LFGGGTTGGTGGLGGTGGAGGAGGTGGTGGHGGGGAGGSIKLSGTAVTADGAVIDLSGGEAGFFYYDGGAGRFVMERNTTLGTLAGATIIGSSVTTTGPRQENPFILAGEEETVETPYIPLLNGGAAAYGLLDVDAQTLLGAEVFTQAPDGAALAVIRIDGGIPGLIDAFQGYDIVLFANLTDQLFLDPKIGFGAIDFRTELLQGGFANEARFGGSGPQVIQGLDGFQVYMTLIEEGTDALSASAVLDGVDYFGDIESLADGQVLYIREPGLRATVDQRLAPADVTFGGRSWESLGTITVGNDGRDLEVLITRAGQGIVAADGVLFRRVDETLPNLEYLGLNGNPLDNRAHDYFIPYLENAAFEQVLTTTTVVPLNGQLGDDLSLTLVIAAGQSTTIQVGVTADMTRDNATPEDLIEDFNQSLEFVLEQNGLPTDAVVAAVVDGKLAFIPGAGVTSVTVSALPVDGQLESDLHVMLEITKKSGEVDFLRIDLGAAETAGFTDAAALVAAVDARLGAALAGAGFAPGAVTASLVDGAIAFDVAGPAISSVVAFNANALGLFTVQSIGTEVAFDPNAAPDLRPIANRGDTLSAVSFNGEGFGGAADGAARVLDDAKTLTLETWFKVDAFTNAWMPLIQKTESNDYLTRSYSLWVNSNGYLHFTSSNGASQDFVDTPGGSIQAGRWYHFAGVLNREEGRIEAYLNGELVGVNAVSTSSSSFLSDSAALLFGATIESSPAYSRFNGDIDEVRLWNVARSLDDIRRDMTQALPAGTEGLLGYWKLDEIGGDVLIDSSGNGNDGIIFNSTRIKSPVRVTALDSPGDTLTIRATSSDPELRVTVSGGELFFTPLKNFRGTALITVEVSDSNGILHDYRGRTDSYRFEYTTGKNALYGTKWNDLDGDGQRDQDELPLDGIVVFIDQDGDFERDAGEPFTITDANGEYAFRDLTATPEAPAQVTAVNSTTPDGGARVVTNNLGNFFYYDPVFFAGDFTTFNATTAASSAFAPSLIGGLDYLPINYFYTGPYEVIRTTLRFTLQLTEDGILSSRDIVLTPEDTAGNASLAALIADLNAKIAAAGWGDRVEAALAGDRVAFRTIEDAGIGDILRVFASTERQRSYYSSIFDFVPDVTTTFLAGAAGFASSQFDEGSNDPLTIVEIPFPGWTPTGGNAFTGLGPVGVQSVLFTVPGQIATDVDFGNLQVAEIDLDGPSEGVEGDTLSYSATVTLVGFESDLPLGLRWSVVDASGEEVASGEGDGFDFVPADEGIYTLRLVVGIDAGEEGGGEEGGEFEERALIDGPSDVIRPPIRGFIPIAYGATRIIEITNAPPTVLFTTPYGVLFEGGSLSLDGLLIGDPGSGDTLNIVIDWGDGSDPEEGILGEGGLANSHTYLQDGDYEIVVTVVDDDGGIARAERTLTVDNVAPELLALPEAVEALEGDLLVFGYFFESFGDQAYFRVIDGEAEDDGDGPRTLYFDQFGFTDPGLLDVHTATIDWGDGSAVESADVVFFGPAGVIFTSHRYLQDGIYDVKVSLSDADGGSDSGGFTATIGNRPPRPVDDEYVLDEDTSLSVAAKEGVLSNDFDVPADTLKARLIEGPTHGTLEFNADGSFTYKPNADFAGDDQFVYEVSDDDTSVQAIAYLFVVNVNDAPVLSGPLTGDVNELETLTLEFAAADVDSDDTVFFALWDAPEGMSIDETGQLTWTPSEEQGPGTFTFTVVAGDASEALSTLEVTVTVNEVNIAPDILASEPYGIGENETLSFQVEVDDPDLPANAIKFSLVGEVPEGLVLDAETGKVSWTPGELDGGSIVQILVRATDDGTPSLFDEEVFSIVVEERNERPVLGEIADAVVDEGTTLAFSALATDADLPANAITYSLIGQVPAGATLDPLSGAFSWTPTEAQGPGRYAFLLRASDGIAFDEEAFTVEVKEVNVAPTLAPVPDFTAEPGDTLTLDLEASDPDQPANTLSFKLLGDVPAGARLDAKTGRFVWTPGFDQAGQSYAFTAEVSDGTATDTEDFTVTVTAGFLEVTSMTPTATGFRIEFNRAFDATKVNLYDVQGAPFGPADVVLTLNSGNAPTIVRGSVVVDEDSSGFEFIRTGGPLAQGAYAITLRSAANGFTDTEGRALDGDGNGVNGDNYAAPFTVAPSELPPLTLSIADFARGPGQKVEVPPTLKDELRLPIQISGAPEFNGIAFSLDYDPALLRFRTVSAALDGVTVTFEDDAENGLLKIEVTAVRTLNLATATNLVFLQAFVHAEAPYREAQILDLRDISAQGAVGDDGLHVVAYLGDATGDAELTTFDVQKIQRVSQALDSGFAAFPAIDPVVIGDLNGGGIGRFDSPVLLAELQGSNRPEVPPVPADAPVIDGVALDRNVSVGVVVGTPGQRIVLPVYIDNRQALESAQMRISYDPAFLSLASIGRGDIVSSGTGWFVPKIEAPGVAYFDTSWLGAVPTSGTGILAQLTFDILQTRFEPGFVPVRIEWVKLNGGTLDDGRSTDGGVGIGIGLSDALAAAEEAAASGGGGGSGALRAASLDFGPVIDWTIKKKEEQVAPTSTVEAWRPAFVNALATATTKTPTPTQGFRLEPSVSGDDAKPLYDLPKSSAF
jgi:hypothetical protein